MFWIFKRAGVSLVLRFSTLINFYAFAFASVYTTNIKVFVGLGSTGILSWHIVFESTCRCRPTGSRGYVHVFLLPTKTNAISIPVIGSRSSMEQVQTSLPYATI